MPQLVASSIGLVHYFPILTTIFAVVFFTQLLGHYLTHRSGVHLLWWGAGVFAFGLGTALESAITLFGNTVWLNKSWYIAGALLGAYPLAQGTVFLLFKRRDAIILTLITLPLVFAPIVLVVLSPIHPDTMEDGESPTKRRDPRLVVDSTHDSASKPVRGNVLDRWRDLQRDQILGPT